MKLNFVSNKHPVLSLNKLQNKIHRDSNNYDNKLETIKPISVIVQQKLNLDFESIYKTSKAFIRNNSVKLTTSSFVKSSLNDTLNVLINLKQKLTKHLLNRNNLKLLKNQKFDCRHSQNFAQRLAKIDVRSINTNFNQSTSRFTVIRSGFIFKKSREQFGLTQTCCKYNLNLNKTQMQILAQQLVASKCLSELKINYYI